MSARWASRARLVWILPVAATCWGNEAWAQPPPGQTYSAVYRAAVQFLRDTPEEVWFVSEGQGVLLAEALRADISVAGPRSSSELASLELSALDARARRITALAPLGLGVSADVNALLAEIKKQRPNNLALDPTPPPSGLRHSPNYLVGAANVRVPIPLDNALAIRGLWAAGVTGSSPAPNGNYAQDALLYLLEFQLADGSWPLAQDALGGVPPQVGDPLVTAEVVRALLPYRNFQFTYEAADAAALGINLDIDAALDEATDFLAAANYSSAVDRAVSLLTYLEGALDPSDPAIDAAHANLLELWIAGDGSFDHSPFATALAAQAILAAASLPRFAFDTDGDGVPDGPDPDSDFDGSCDPGEMGASCTGTDAFPLHALEQADSDGDGVGDNADTDDDGDGVADLDEGAHADDPSESGDADRDGIADFADPDDDNDGVSDVEEGLAGTNPRDPDTDGDSFLDGLEVAAGTDGADSSEFPPPDGDIFPMGDLPDGVVDLRDVLLAIRVLRGEETPANETIFYRHADVAPMENGTPAPDGEFNAGDVLLILRRSQGELSW